MSTLVSCAGCKRHIRRSEATCPFCGVGVTTAVAAAPERALPPPRLSRAALMAFAAAAVGASACSGQVTPVYGAPAPIGDASANGGETSSGGTAASGGTGGVTNSGGASAVALYSAPAAGFANAGGKTASGGTTNDADGGDGGPASGGEKGAGGATIAPLYGAPMNIYGAPPAK